MATEKEKMDKFEKMVRATIKDPELIKKKLKDHRKLVYRDKR